MKKQITILVIAVAVSGCISSKRIDGFVHKYYAKNPIKKAENPNWVYNNSNKSIDSFSTSERTKALFIPAILYWQWHTIVYSDLNDNIVNLRFYHYLNSKSDSLELPELLNGRKIDKFTEAPDGFFYIHKGFSIILIVAYSVSDLVAIKPIEDPYRLKYVLYDHNQKRIDEGEVSMDNTELPMKNVWKSAKKFTWAYLDEYHKHQDMAFAGLIDKIENNLRKQINVQPGGKQR